MASSTLLNDLRQHIGTRDVLVIVGSGVSVGATNGDQIASWTGLLEHGLQRCLEVCSLEDEWFARKKTDLHSSDMDDTLSVAEIVASKLGSPDGGEYRRWLRESVGGLRVVDRSVLEALRDLELPIATTNYDGLIEEVTGLPPVTWLDGASVERVIRDRDPGILHLHGHWERPESVVLGIRDYQRVLGDSHAQTMLKALRSTRTLLILGCGEGLRDPNFGAFLRWTRGIFSGSEYRHFRLALEKEAASLQSGHPKEERIFVLSYGTNHGDLAPFLRSLGPSSPTTASTSSSPP